MQRWGRTEGRPQGREKREGKMSVKVTIISEGAKINYVPLKKDSVVDIPDDLVGPWVQAGLCVVGEVVPNIAPAPPKVEPVEKPKKAKE